MISNISKPDVSRCEVNAEFKSRIPVFSKGVSTTEIENVSKVSLSPSPTLIKTRKSRVSGPTSIPTIDLSWMTKSLEEKSTTPKHNISKKANNSACFRRTNYRNTPYTPRNTEKSLYKPGTNVKSVSKCSISKMSSISSRSFNTNVDKQTFTLPVKSNRTLNNLSSNKMSSSEISTSKMSTSSFCSSGKIMPRTILPKKEKPESTYNRTLGAKFSNGNAAKMTDRSFNSSKIIIEKSSFSRTIKSDLKMGPRCSNKVVEKTPVSRSNKSTNSSFLSALKAKALPRGSSSFSSGKNFQKTTISSSVNSSTSSSKLLGIKRLNTFLISKNNSRHYSPRTSSFSSASSISFIKRMHTFIKVKSEAPFLDRCEMQKHTEIFTSTPEPKKIISRCNKNTIRQTSSQTSEVKTILNPIEISSETLEVGFNEPSDEIKNHGIESDPGTSNSNALTLCGSLTDSKPEPKENVAPSISKLDVPSPNCNELTSGPEETGASSNSVQSSEDTVDNTRFTEEIPKQRGSCVPTCFLRCGQNCNEKNSPSSKETFVSADGELQTPPAETSVSSIKQRINSILQTHLHRRIMHWLDGWKYTRNDKWCK